MKTAIAMREDKMAIEYIDRAEYCEKHCRCSNEYCDRQSCPIWKAPAADVAPVVHGRWISFLDGDHIMPDDTTDAHVAAEQRVDDSRIAIAVQRWMVRNENLQKSVGDARKLLCENWCCKVGKDGGIKIQRLFY